MTGRVTQVVFTLTQFPTIDAARFEIDGEPLTVLGGETATGFVVCDRAAMATSGTGTRGTFDVTTTFQVPREGMGSVIVFESSAQGGRPIHLVEIPVRISR